MLHWLFHSEFSEPFDWFLFPLLSSIQGIFHHEDWFPCFCSFQVFFSEDSSHQFSHSSFQFEFWELFEWSLFSSHHVFSEVDSQFDWLFCSQSSDFHSQFSDQLPEFQLFSDWLLLSKVSFNSSWVHSCTCLTHFPCSQLLASCWFRASVNSFWAHSWVFWTCCCCSSLRSCCICCLILSLCILSISLFPNLSMIGHRISFFLFILSLLSMVTSTISSKCSMNLSNSSWTSSSTI